MGCEYQHISGSFYLLTQNLCVTGGIWLYLRNGRMFSVFFSVAKGKAHSYALKKVNEIS